MILAYFCLIVNQASDLDILNSTQSTCYNKNIAMWKLKIHLYKNLIDIPATDKGLD